MCPSRLDSSLFECIYLSNLSREYVDFACMLNMFHMCAILFTKKKKLGETKTTETFFVNDLFIWFLFGNIV